MKKQKLLNDIEIHQSIMQTLFRLAKTNIIESANSIIDIFDENHPISFNFILAQTIYTISMFRMNDFDIYSKFLKQIEIFEENNKINSKIFDVFEGILLSKYSEESKYILYYLFENKFLQSPKVDYKRTNGCFAHHMTQEEINEYYCYGIKQYIKKHYEELSKNDWELHKKYIEEGHNPNEITKIIRDDEIEKLQEISSQNDFDFNQIIEPSVYERCDFINQYRITLIEYAAFFSSVKCFKYLLMNGAKVENTGKYAVAGGNEEIIHLCEQNHSSFKDAYETAIKFHCNDIFKYLYENKLEDIKNLEFLGKKCIKWNNYELFTYLQKEGMEINDDIINAAARIGNKYLTKYFMKEHHTPKDILGYSSKSGNIELVKYILDQEGTDINAEDIHLFYLKFILII